nr:Chain C, LCMV peptidic epitope np396 [synthetic construct]
FQPQNGQFI